MSDLETQLRASLLDDSADDADFIADARAFIDARPLSEDVGLTISGNAAARLVRLAEEALRSRHALEAPPQVGAKGRLVALLDQDDRARLIAHVEFDDEDQLRRAGAMIAADVSIEPVFATEAANESTPGQGSPQNGRESK